MTSVTVGSAYSFRPTASDPDGDSLSFSDRRSAGVGQLQCEYGPTLGHAGRWRRGRVLRYPHQRVRRYGFRGHGAVRDHCRSLAQPGTDHRRNSGDVGHGRLRLRIHADRGRCRRRPADVLDYRHAPWGSFDTASGRLSGTPIAGDEVCIQVSASACRTATTPPLLPAFAITVEERPNQPPTISGSPATSVSVGSAYSFTPTASDPDGDSLSFSISGLPGWATFDSNSGELSGTPADGDEGVYSDIRISVSDGTDSAALASFSITVDGLPNEAPTIGGTPPTEVTVDSAYSFTPTASDPDGDTLTFSITGEPAWASFDPSTGRLSGTPATGDLGTYSGIRISVSDGAETASLPDFSISVVPISFGAATLSWDAPTQNADGSPLSDLAGFKVYYGPTVDSMTSVEIISNPTVNIHLVENLTAGEWFFKVTASIRPVMRARIPQSSAR